MGGPAAIVGAKDRKEFESRVERLEYKPDKKAIAADLKSGVAVPGADLKFGDWRPGDRLERRRQQ